MTRKSPKLSAPPDLVTAAPTVARDAQAIAAKRVRNEQNSDNMLPPELLSRIFIIAGEAERSTRPTVPTTSYLGIQDRVTQVCSYWRNVAINTPALWTHIHITRRAPHDELAYLYLSRAGNSALLDIDIEICSRYWKRSPFKQFSGGIYHKTFHEVLELLATNGADVNRWRSLSIRAKGLETLFEMVKLLSVKSALALQFLSFEWDIPNISSNRWADKELAARRFYDIEIANASDCLSKLSAPNLRCAELVHVSNQFLPEPPLLPFAQLTRFSYTCTQAQFSNSNLLDALSGCPLLESLSLNSGFARYYFDWHPNDKRICLPSLCSFSISTTTLQWVWDILQSLDAPALQSFAISTNYLDEEEDGDGEINQLAHCIATGEFSPSLFDPSPGQPIYPSLRELDISEFGCGCNASLNMFLAMPLITHLSVRETQVDHLGSAPWPLPNLEYLKFPQTALYELCDILRCRTEAGYPIKSVGLTERWEWLGERIAGFTKVEVLPVVTKRNYDPALLSDHCPYGSLASDEDNSSGDRSSDSGSDPDLPSGTAATYLEIED